MLTIRPAQIPDWPCFYQLAEEEGWLIPCFERQLFAGEWADAVRVVDIDGQFGGLITVAVYQRSGWIGNLLVPPALRGRGYGGVLFKAALKLLEPCASCWLTASTVGRPIYEKAGFVRVDQVERWVCLPGNFAGRQERCTFAPAVALFESDRRAWGEDRSALLEKIAAGRQPFVCDDSVVLLQRELDVQIIGPWYSCSCSPQANRQLLQSVLAFADPNKSLVIDLLASSPVRTLLAAAGFERAGRTDLMVKGDPSAVDLSMLVSFASLGSIG